MLKSKSTFLNFKNCSIFLNFKNCSIFLNLITVKQNSNNASLNNMNFKIVPHFEFNNHVKNKNSTV